MRHKPRIQFYNSFISHYSIFFFDIVILLPFLHLHFKLNAQVQMHLPVTWALYNCSVCAPSPQNKQPSHKKSRCDVTQMWRLTFYPANTWASCVLLEETHCRVTTELPPSCTLIQWRSRLLSSNVCFLLLQQL